MSEDTTFFWGVAILLAWALWPRRSLRFRAAPWALALLAAVTLGYWGQRGLGNLDLSPGPGSTLNYTNSNASSPGAAWCATPASPCPTG